MKLYEVNQAIEGIIELLGILQRMNLLGHIQIDHILGVGRRRIA